MEKYSGNKNFGAPFQDIAPFQAKELHCGLTDPSEPSHQEDRPMALTYSGGQAPEHHTGTG